MQEKYIFRYVLADAWGELISQVDIVDTGENGSARGLYFESSEDMGIKECKKVKSCIKEISRHDINKIRAIMWKYYELLFCKELEHPMVADGYLNTFFLNPDEEHFTIIDVSNIWAFRDNVDVGICEEPPYRACDVLNMYDDICEVLMKNGMDKKYLSLGK